MKTSTTILTLVSLLSSSVLLAQSYCVPPGFLDMGGVGEPFTHIARVQLEDLDNSSTMPTGVGDDNGYMYYDNATVPVLQPGSTYTLNVTAADNLGQGMEVGVWIDWNGDMEFDANSEKVAYWAPSGMHSTDITVPETASGTVRMRVGCDMPPSMGHIPLEPCGYLDYPSHQIGIHGEFEDYDIQIGGTTGILNTESYNDFKIFPNPATDIVTINHDFKENTIVRILDITSRTMVSDRLDAQTKTLDISDLKTGQYIMMIEGTTSPVHKPLYITR